MPTPDVSVVIPTYNRRDRLEKAIASCFDENEDIRIEVVVVDDGSTDETRTWMEALADDRIRYVRQEDEGAQVARNKGMELATGRYTKFLDDDDRLLPGALSGELETVEAEEAAIGCGHLLVRDPEGQYALEQKPAPDLISGIFRGAVQTHLHTFLYRSTALTDCRWDPTIPYHQDTAFAVQATTQGLSEMILDFPVGIYHDHEGSNISNNVKSRVAPVERAQLQVDFIEAGIRRLRKFNSLKDYHIEAAAEGMWQWAHIIGGYDLPAFLDVYDRIEAIQPDFVPSRQSALLSVLDSVVGVRRMERILYPVRRAKRAIQRAKT